MFTRLLCLNVPFGARGAAVVAVELLLVGPSLERLQLLFSSDHTEELSLKRGQSGPFGS